MPGGPAPPPSPWGPRRAGAGCGGGRRPSGAARTSGAGGRPGLWGSSGAGAASVLGTAAPGPARPSAFVRPFRGCRAERRRSGAGGERGKGPNGFGAVRRCRAWRLFTFPRGPDAAKGIRKARKGPKTKVAHGTRLRSQFWSQPGSLCPEHVLARLRAATLRLRRLGHGRAPWRPLGAAAARAPPRGAAPALGQPQRREPPHTELGGVSRARRQNAPMVSKWGEGPRWFLFYFSAVSFLVSVDVVLCFQGVK